MANSELDPRRQLEILSQSYITTKDMTELYPVTRSWARREFHRIRSELESEGKKVIVSREVFLPIKEVLKRYPVDEKRIREYASIREEKKKQKG